MDHRQASHLIDRYLLHSFVPLNALTRAHLEYLMRDHDVETRVAGGPLFARGDSDGFHVYLLHGSIRLRDAAGAVSVIEAGEASTLLPIADHPVREHDAVAASDCRIIRFERDLLDRMLCWDQVADYLISDISGSPEMDDDADWMIMLLRSNLFYRVPPMNMPRVFDRFEPVVVEAGATIVRQGEVGDCCYVIKEGRAEVLREQEHVATLARLALLDPGRCFGDDALYLEKARNATVKMIADGVLMRLAKSDYQQLTQPPAVRHTDIAEARAALEAGSILLDVRSQYEYESGHCRGAVNFPLNLLKLKSPLLPLGRHYITCCNSGRRSASAAYLLERLGHDVSALAPGIDDAAPADRAWLTAERQIEYWIGDDGVVAAD